MRVKVVTFRSTVEAERGIAKRVAAGWTVASHVRSGGVITKKHTVTFTAPDPEPVDYATAPEVFVTWKRGSLRGLDTKAVATKDAEMEAKGFRRTEEPNKLGRGRWRARYERVAS